MSAGLGENTAVAEMQGLDGAFSFAERLLQRIWLHGDFDRARAVTSDGRKVRVLCPGSWNRLGGPDFRRARLELGGLQLEGDVELHLRATDWRAHGHPADPKYENVVLHVVLYPPQDATFASDGSEIPCLALLPLLYRSLEEYADEEAVERLANHPLTAAHRALLELKLEEQRAVLDRCAGYRWQQKINFAAKRIQRLGWEDACHQTALEILGYRFNRGPMLLLSAQHPLCDWPEVAQGASFERLCAEYAPRWNRQAIRPANHPKKRLLQYAALTAAIPCWPGKLKQAAKLLPNIRGTEYVGTGEFRKRVRLLPLIEMVAQDVFGRALGGPRLQTLIADGCWPLLAAALPDREAELKLYWYHGYCGDIPANIARLLAALEITGGRASPLCHGIAQGMLAWVWREEERSQQTTACSCGRAGGPDRS